jgi:hypothetical protein
MLWTAAVESTHNHPNRTEAASCTICVVAHTASPAPISPNTTPVFATVGLLSEQDAVPNPWLGFSDFGIRGPPVVL